MFSYSMFSQVPPVVPLSTPKGTRTPIWETLEYKITLFTKINIIYTSSQQVMGNAMKTMLK